MQLLKIMAVGFAMVSCTQLQAMVSTPMAPITNPVAFKYAQQDLVLAISMHAINIEDKIREDIAGFGQEILTEPIDFLRFASPLRSLEFNESTMTLRNFAQQMGNEKATLAIEKVLNNLP